MNLLIAEDDLTSRTMLSAILSKWGYQVTAAVDGNQAWDLLRQPQAPKLVLLDWMMPGMDGMEVCRRIRDVVTPQPPYIILLTAKDNKKDIVLGLNAGANDYVSKPFDNDELQARIEVGARVIELQEILAKRIEDLQEALTHIKRLQGILPICMHCHKIRTDMQSWQKLEDYLVQHSEAKFSHGICEACLEKHHPE
jgi:phosphoserine phosphatase RsbU/P